MPTEKYADLAKPKKPPSLVRSFLLALLMLFGVFVLSPLMDMMREQKTRVGLTEEVEIPEPESAPVLPEVVPLLPEPREALPRWEDDARPVVELDTDADAALDVGSGSAGLLDPMGEISGIATGPAPAAVPALDREPILVDAAGLREQLASLLPAGAAGTAVLRASVDPTGEVAAVEVVETSDEAFAAAAMEVLRGAAFAPAIRDGVPVQAEVRLPIEL